MGNGRRQFSPPPTAFQGGVDQLQQVLGAGAPVPAGTDSLAPDLLNMPSIIAEGTAQLAEGGVHSGIPTSQRLYPSPEGPLLYNPETLGADTPFFGPNSHNLMAASAPVAPPADPSALSGPALDVYMGSGAGLLPVETLLASAPALGAESLDALSSVVNGPSSTLAATPEANALWNADALGVDPSQAAFNANATEAGGGLFDGGGAGAGFGIGDALALYGIYSGASGLYEGFGTRDPVSGAMSGLQMGASIGNIVPGIGTAAGAIIGTVLGAVIGNIKAGKHQDQIERDALRSHLQENAVDGEGNPLVDADFNITNASGGKFNIGREKVDGGARTYETIDRPDIDFEGEVIGMMNPLGIALGGDDKRLQTNMVNFLTNSVTQGKGGPNEDNRNNVNQSVETFVEAQRNALDFYRRAGIDSLDSARALVDQLEQQGKISGEDAEAMRAGQHALWSNARIIDAPQATFREGQGDGGERAIEVAPITREDVTSRPTDTSTSLDTPVAEEAPTFSPKMAGAPLSAALGVPEQESIIPTGAFSTEEIARALGAL